MGSQEQTARQRLVTVNNCGKFVCLSSQRCRVCTYDNSLATSLADDQQPNSQLVEQGLTPHSTQFRSFRRQCFYWSDDPTNIVEALKEGG